MFPPAKRLAFRVTAKPSSGIRGGQARAWRSDGTSFSLPLLPGGGSAVALGVSGNGSVVVGGQSGQAFRWTQATGTQGLGFPIGLGTGRSVATAISADGSVIVGSSTLPLPEPFRWTQATGVVLLGAFEGSTNGVAQAVSADGSTIVGFYSVAEAHGSQAFIWTAAGGVQSLSDVLTRDGIDLTGWTLDSANAISADGKTIAGAGVDPLGHSEAWIATIEVPVQIAVENPIDLSSPVPVSVAILGSDTVDVTKIDVTTLRFGPKGATPVLDLTDPAIYQLSLRDVNQDGHLDLSAAFGVQDTGLALGDTQACLQGKIDGLPFQGCTSVVITAGGCGLGFELAPILPPLLGCGAGEGASWRNPIFVGHAQASVGAFSFGVGALP